MFFLLPKDNKRENVATSLKDYLNVLKVPGVWLVAYSCTLRLQCAGCGRIYHDLSDYRLWYGGSNRRYVATIRSYGIGIFSAPIIGKISDKVGSYTKTLIGLFAWR